MQKEYLKINLGCGAQVMPGFKGVDILPGPNVDYVCDFEKDFLPFEDSSVEEVYCSNVLEHIDNLPRLMRELARICRAGARIDIVVPHFNGVGAFQDPTHRRFFTYDTFKYFSDDSSFPHYDFVTAFEIIGRKICFVKTPKNFFDYFKNPCRAFCELVVKFIPNLYETSVLRIIPSTDLRVKLVVKK